MPYIKIKDRKRFKKILVDIANDAVPENGGELNYLLYSIVMLTHEVSKQNYSSMAEILAAIEGCKTEFYRRVIAPYENEKIDENGDVLEVM